VYIHHIFFIDSLVDGHLGKFHNLAIVNSAVILKHGCANIASLLYVDLDVFGYISRSGTAGSYGRSIYIFEEFPY
jgi:hypothetical protein